LGEFVHSLTFFQQFSLSEEEEEEQQQKQRKTPELIHPRSLLPMSPPHSLTE
jgi:hypothetical protein